ncbi:hypothetical protein NPIL_410811 [Nephila pilipes]|uniref:Uncharacterized protein n=1 Tax=Nephila pilipes TaxID=299642 RepID=A0A8X6JPH9_NEPPI|nr:hypothetical protein NPIL_410811 [Nephila pilipes]
MDQHPHLSCRACAWKGNLLVIRRGPPRSPERERFSCSFVGVDHEGETNHYLIRQARCPLFPKDSVPINPVSSGAFVVFSKNATFSKVTKRLRSALRTPNNVLQFHPIKSMLQAYFVNLDLASPQSII